MKFKYFTMALAAGALAAVLGSPEIADARGGGGGGHGGGFGGGRGGFGGGHVGGMGGMGMRGMGCAAQAPCRSRTPEWATGASAPFTAPGSTARIFTQASAISGLGTSTEAFRRSTAQRASIG